MTDIVKIAFYAYDKDGAVSITFSNEIPARIEDTNRIIRDIDGKEQKANMLVLFEYDRVITKLDKLLIIKKYGDSYEDPSYEFEIIKLEKTGMFKGTHYEVFL